MSDQVTVRSAPEKFRCTNCDATAWIPPDQAAIPDCGNCGGRQWAQVPTEPVGNPWDPHRSALRGIERNTERIAAALKGQAKTRRDFAQEALEKFESAWTSDHSGAMQWFSDWLRGQAEGRGT